MRTLIFSRYSTEKIETDFLFLTLFGYIVVYINFWNIEILNHVLNVSLRIILLAASIFLIYKNKKSISQRKIPILSFCLFYFLLIVKHFITYFFWGFSSDIRQDALQELVFFGLIVIPIPVVSLLLLDYNSVDFNRLYRMMLIFFFAIISAYFFSNLALGFPAGGMFFKAYYILFGHYAATMITVSVLDLLVLRKFPDYISVSAIIMASVLLLDSASRSAVLALAIQLSLIIIIFFKDYIVYWVGICLLLLIVLIIGYYYNPQFAFFKRMGDAIIHADASGRSYYYRKGLEEFLSSPLIGGRAKFFNNTYPHNIFLDILMATGIIGAAVIFFYYKFVVKSLGTIFNQAKELKWLLFLPLVYIQYLVLDQFSASALLNYESWFFSAVIIGIYFKLNNEKIKSDDGGRNPSRNYKTGARSHRFG